MPRASPRFPFSDWIVAANAAESIINLRSSKPQINYPCQWVYKVIGRDRGRLETAIAEIVDIPYSIHLSHYSRAANYVCLNVEVEVTDESLRNDLYLGLKDHQDVILVL